MFQRSQICTIFGLVVSETDYGRVTVCKISLLTLLSTENLFNSHSIGGTIWRKHRLLLNPAFSSESIQSYQKIVEKRCLILKDVVAKHCTEEVCDIKKILITHSVNVLAGELFLLK